MAGYCTRADLYSFGLPRGTIPNPGRLLLSVDAGADRLLLGDHGFALNDPVSFRAELGGALPSPLVAGVQYFAIPVTDDLFQVSATSGGAAINLTTAGSEILVMSPLPVDSAIDWGKEAIDQVLIAHAVPLEAPYPPIVVMTNAELAAAKLGFFSGAGSKSLADMLASANTRLEKWAKGVPLRGANVKSDDRTNLAVSASVPYADRRGWSRFGGPC